MKRLHIHLKTEDLDRSIDFYTAMFGQAPVRRETDYAKWLLDDPAANVSLSTHGGKPGVDHVGISVESRNALEDIAERLRRAGNALKTQEATTCCYAQSNKFWARDPQGAIWELFQTFGDSDTYGAEPDRALANPQTSQKTPCCAPAA